MKHLSEGTLRRLEDEPEAVAWEERAHLAACGHCQAVQRQVREDARQAATLFSAPPKAVDRAAAFWRVQQLLAGEDERRQLVWNERMIVMVRNGRNRLVKPLAGVAAAAAVAGGLFLTPAGAWASANILPIFEPTHVTAVAIDPNDLQTLPSLSEYGTIQKPQRGQMRSFTDGVAAAQAAQLPLLQPAALPAGVPSQARYEVVPTETGSFTFSAAKAKAAAAAQGKQAPTMPADLDGTTLRVTTGNALVAVYGADNLKAAGAAAEKQAQKDGAAQGDAAVRSRDLTALAQSAGPVMIIGEMKAPQITTSNANVSAAQLEQYILDQPGVSPQLAQALRALGDPKYVLPIPVPVNSAAWENVTVQGVSGLAIADNTGIGGGIVWEKDGVIYGVAGTLTKSQLLAAANSLQAQ